MISGAGFSLAAGGAEQVELAPGDVYDVNIVAALPGRGWLTFHPLGPDSVQRFIQIDSPP